MMNKLLSITVVIILFAFLITGCNNTNSADEQIYTEVTDLQLVLLNHVSYKKDLETLEGKSIEGLDSLIDDKYKYNISGGETLVNELSGYTLIDYDYGDPTGFNAAAYTKGNNLVLVYVGTSDFKDKIEDVKSAFFDVSVQDGQAKQFAKDNVNSYKDYNLYITGYSMGGRLCYLGTEEVIDNDLGNNLKKVRTFNGLGIKEALDTTDSHLSNMHNLQVKFANKTYDYIVENDFVSDGDSESSWMHRLKYNHVGTEFKIPCTNEIDTGDMKQHDLYSIIDYLLHNPEPGTASDSQTEVSKEESIEPSTVAAPADQSTQPEASVDYLIGDWSTSDGVILSFYDDGFFEMEWGYFPTEEGEWDAEALSEDTYYLDMDGSLILSLMSLAYGSADSDYHFEILKNGDNSFYLVQVYGDYTAQTSPCKLTFTRN